MKTFVTKRGVELCTGISEKLEEKNQALAGFYLL
jgi:hypothetical protein